MVHGRHGWVVTGSMQKGESSVMLTPAVGGQGVTAQSADLTRTKLRNPNIT